MHIKFDSKLEFAFGFPKLEEMTELMCSPNISCICLSATNAFCMREIRVCRKGLSLFANTFDNILKE